MSRSFNKTQIQCLRKLIGSKLSNIFKQLDFLIINFGEAPSFSLHVYCFVLITMHNQILLSSFDECCLSNHKIIQDYNRDNENLIKKTLLEKTRLLVIDKLADSYVADVHVDSVGNIFIIFDNNAVINIYLDSQLVEQEFYRFIDFSLPNKPHLIVKAKKGFVFTEYLE